jgi:uncharacterized protein YciI
MFFVITAIDKPNSLALRMANREAHLAYANKTGQVRLGGPFLDADGNMAGSMLILEAADLAAAKTWATNDPYAKAGLFAQSDVRPWKMTVNACGATL